MPRRLCPITAFFVLSAAGAAQTLPAAVEPSSLTAMRIAPKGAADYAGAERRGMCHFTEARQFAKTHILTVCWSRNF